MSCSIDNAKHLHTLLSCLSLGRKKDQQVRCDIDPSGLYFTAHSKGKSVQIKTSLASDLFDSYEYHVEETLGFRISLHHLLDGLSVFGTSSMASTSVTCSFDEDTSCFQMVLTENGVLAECAIHAMVQDDLNDFTQGDFERSFESSIVAGRVIIQSNALLEVANEFSDLPPAASIEIKMYPDKAFQLRAETDGSSCEIDVDKSSPALIEYEASTEIASTFQWSLLQHSFQGLHFASESFVRLNAEGYCSIQHMALLGSKRAFIDALLCPDAT
ncbi:hypothetical protein Ae201684P_006292 [Aphanomyces euteiches]|nr:hypothetical protein Ae201684P_006292 [Aphanomyces euteiches]KAH9138761.1 hypothetical protein AeRB84_016957 [Aphanomyces euteiches]